MNELIQFGPPVVGTVILLAIWRFIVGPELKASRENQRESLKHMAQAAASWQATAEAFERVMVRFDKGESPRLRISENGASQ